MTQVNNSKKNLQSMIDLYSKDIAVKDWQIKWVDEMLARAYINLVEKWVTGELTKSDSIFLNVLEQISTLNDYTTKEKVVRHEFDIPKIDPKHLWM